MPDQKKRGTAGSERHAQMLHAVRRAVAVLLHESDWPTSIAGAIRELGEATGVSRVYVFENHTGDSGELLTSQHCEWVASGITPEIDNPELQSLPYMASGFERWAIAMQEGQAMHGIVRDLPPDEQAYLAPQQIRSIVTVPIMIEAEWWGFIGFDDCHEEREWTDSEVNLLRIAADCLAAAVVRRDQASLVSRSPAPGPLPQQQITAMLDFFDKQSAETKQAQRLLNGLTDSERGVVELLSMGYANKAIAFELGISLRTVEKRRHDIMRKLSIDSLAELVRLVVAAERETPD